MNKLNVTDMYKRNEQNEMKLRAQPVKELSGQRAMETEWRSVNSASAADYLQSHRFPACLSGPPACLSLPVSLCACVVCVCANMNMRCCNF